LLYQVLTDCCILRLANLPAQPPQLSQLVVHGGCACRFNMLNLLRGMEVVVAHR
jgi:hypothetical protein